MDYRTTIVAVVAIPTAWLVFKKLRGSDIADIPSPNTPWSFMLGTTTLRRERYFAGVLIIF